VYTSIPTQNSCARAWAAAAAALSTDREAYNVIVDVDKPSFLDTVDHAIISLVDQFLRGHDGYSIATVANTIFPQSLYERYGSPAFFLEYLEIYDTFRSTKRWGRYFERMIRHQVRDGTQVNPLEQLVEKLRAACSRKTGVSQCV